MVYLGWRRSCQFINIKLRTDAFTVCSSWNFSSIFQKLFFHSSTYLTRRNFVPWSFTGFFCVPSYWNFLVGLNIWLKKKSHCQGSIISISWPNFTIYGSILGWFGLTFSKFIDKIRNQNILAKIVVSGTYGFLTWLLRFAKVIFGVGQQDKLTKLVYSVIFCSLL